MSLLRPSLSPSLLGWLCGELLFGHVPEVGCTNQNGLVVDTSVSLCGLDPCYCQSILRVTGICNCVGSASGFPVFASVAEGVPMTLIAITLWLGCGGKTDKLAHPPAPFRVVRGRHIFPVIPSGHLGDSLNVVIRSD